MYSDLGLWVLKVVCIKTFEMAIKNGAELKSGVVFSVTTILWQDKDSGHFWINRWILILKKITIANANVRNTVYNTLILKQKFKQNK